ncbi:ly6/PLAUR domain-containing protein 5-like isoform X4 [Podarcis muralis]
MKRVTLRWRAATVVLQGLLAMTFLISGISALSCHSANSVNHFTPNKGNTTVYVAAVGGIINCSSAQNVCTDAQLTLTIDKDLLIMGYKGCASKDLWDGPISSFSGDRHFAVQYDESYCFGDLCNGHSIKWKVPKTPIEDTAEGSSSNQCYTGFDSTYYGILQQTMRCGSGYNRCYNGSKVISVGGLRTSMIFRTCQRPACIDMRTDFTSNINITSEWGLCCSGSNCNSQIINPTNFGVRSTTNPYLSYDHYGSGFQGLSLQLCPFLAVLGTTILRIWG